MKAIVQDRYGSPDVLEFGDVEKPVAVGNLVLVRVRASSVNAYGWHVMRGDPYLARLMLPAAFGRSHAFADVPAAITYLETHHAQAKVTITI